MQEKKKLLAFPTVRIDNADILIRARKKLNLTILPSVIERARKLVGPRQLSQVTEALLENFCIIQEREKPCNQTKEVENTPP